MAVGGLIYPGSRLHKDVARSSLYEAIRDQWGGTRPSGDAFVLCGPEPRDAEGLWQLGFSQESCWFVDRHSSGLLIAKKRWPATNVFCGEARDLLASMKHLALVNLDLMSHPTREIDDLVGLASSRIVVGGVLALTFARGRENPKHLLRRKLLTMGARTYDEARWRLVRSLMRRRLHHEIYAHSYRDNRLAMGVIAWQR